MPAQTSYTLFQDSYIHGQVVDIHPANEIRSWAAEAVIPFGVAVKRGTLPETQVLPGAANLAGVLGIALRDITTEYAARGDTTLSYPIGKMVSVMRKGYVALKCATAGNPGGANRIVVATGVVDMGAPVGGDFASTANLELQNVIGAGGVGIFRVNF